MHREKGFTLIELMIVVAIVGILAAVAYPSYIDHVRQSNRVTAQAFLMEVLQRQKSYLLQNRVYAQSLSALGLSATSDVTSQYTLATNLGVKSDTDASEGFDLTLTPIEGGMQADDGLLCVTETGARARKACPGNSGAEAW